MSVLLCCISILNLFIQNLQYDAETEISESSSEEEDNDSPVSLTIQL